MKKTNTPMYVLVFNGVVVVRDKVVDGNFEKLVLNFITDSFQELGVFSLFVFST